MKSMLPHLFPEAWGVGDQLILCESIYKQLVSLPPSTPIQQQVVDWNLVAQTVRTRSSRSTETIPSCYNQIMTLSRNLLRLQKVVSVDGYATIHKCINYIRDMRIKDLQRDLQTCKDRLRIYKADMDSISHKPADPSLLLPSASEIPRFEKPPTYYYSVERSPPPGILSNPRPEIFTVYSVPPRTTLSTPASAGAQSQPPSGSNKSSLSSSLPSMASFGATPSSMASGSSSLPPDSASMNTDSSMQTGGNTTDMADTPNTPHHNDNDDDDAHLSDDDMVDMDQTQDTMPLPPPKDGDSSAYDAYARSLPYSIHNPSSDKALILLPTQPCPYLVTLTPRLQNTSLMMAILDEIKSNTSIVGPFLLPVTPEAAPNYFTVIKVPMDFSTLTSLVQNNTITNAFQLFQNLSQIYANALRYNAKNTEIWFGAKDLDTITLSIFTVTFPEYAQLFTSVNIESKKVARRSKPTQRPQNDRPPALPPPHDPASFELAFKQAAPEHQHLYLSRMMGARPMPPPQIPGIPPPQMNGMMQQPIPQHHQQLQPQQMSQQQMPPQQHRSSIPPQGGGLPPHQQQHMGIPPQQSQGPPPPPMHHQPLHHQQQHPPQQLPPQHHHSQQQPPPSQYPPQASSSPPPSHLQQPYVPPPPPGHQHQYDPNANVYTQQPPPPQVQPPQAQPPQHHQQQPPSQHHQHSYQPPPPPHLQPPPPHQHQQSYYPPPPPQ